jgi:hypothetical protein
MDWSDPSLRPDRMLGCALWQRCSRKQAELYDGTIITFPIGTPLNVVTASARSATAELVKLEKLDNKTAKDATAYPTPSNSAEPK